MRKRMEQLIDGTFSYEIPTLIIKPQSIEVTTYEGENVNGELYLETKENVRIKGYISVTNARIVLGEDKFNGSAVTLRYGIDVTGLAAGDKIHGEILLNTGIGEYRIPVFVRIDARHVRSLTGEVNTLDDFAALARSDMREALHLFTSKQFASLFVGENAGYRSLYQGMSRNPVTYQHVEEFLVGAGKKEPVILTVAEPSIELYGVKSSEKYLLEVKKSSWGFLHIDVEVQGECIAAEKKEFTGDDFVGSICQIPLIIYRDKMRDGKNFARVLLRTVYGTQTVNFCVTPNPKMGVDVHNVRGRKLIRLVNIYMDWRLNRIDASEYESKSKAILGSMKITDVYPVEYELYEAYIAFMVGQNTEGKEILRSMQNRSFAYESLQARAYFVYLCHLMDMLTPGQIDIVSKIREWYQAQQENFGLLWTLMQVDEDMNRTPSRKMHEMEHIYGLGCHNPLLYLEAFMLLRLDGTLLKSLTPFIRQVLLFAGRQELFTPDIAQRVYQLSANEKEFSRQIYRILVMAYEQCPSNQGLESICRLVILGNPRRPEYFRWYELAVERELRLTRLYEYYVETMPERYDKTFPLVIRKYFAYNNEMSDGKRAFVYANVIRNKEIDRNTFQEYQGTMEQFAMDKLREGKINENYATLYREFIKKPEDREMGYALSKIIFTYRLYCDDKKVRSVIVCHGALTEETVYPCVDGTAYIRIYSDDAKVIFQDELHRRYVATVDYNMQPLMDQSQYIKDCIDLGVDTPGLQLAVCGGEQIRTPIDSHNFRIFSHVAESESFRTDYRSRIRHMVLDYYAHHMTDGAFDEYLRHISYESYVPENKALLTSTLVAHGQYQRAFEFICQYGYERVETISLLRLASNLIQERSFELDEELLLLAYTVFAQGKYNEVILRYLADYYEGAVDELCRIWIAARGFGLDTYRLNERILALLMFVRRHAPQAGEILQEYISQCGRELIIRAFLTYEAFGYFMDDTQGDAFYFKLLKRMYERDRQMDLICHIALAKYYAETGQIGESDQAVVKALMLELNQKNLRFAFLTKLPQQYLRPYHLLDKVFVEYKAHSDEHVVMHYRICSSRNNSASDTEYKSEPLVRMYRNVCTRDFVLFYGETLEYYLEIESDTETARTEVTSLVIPVTQMQGNDRYNLINQMLADEILGRNESLREKIQQYTKQQQIVHQLFQTKE